MRSSFRLIFCLAVLAFVSSCASVNVEGGAEKLPKVKDQVLIERLNAISALTPNSMYAKISTRYKDSARSQSFKTTLRMFDDSVINVVVSVASLPIYKSIIDEDSLKLTDKINKCLIKKDLSYFKELFGVDFSYENIEELFLGKPLDYDSLEKYYRVHDPSSYLLCSHKKRDIKKNEKATEKEIIRYYQLNDSLTSLKSMIIEVPEDNISVELVYTERKIVDGYDLPQKVDIFIKTKDSEVLITMDYKKFRINSKETIHFVIPNDYDECE